ncbi:hypothetical protein AAG570_013391 [Ranatra chinensis]|uniref:EGF-like domain-containing protein n=1 Tax=Ranatra chinensis TaxID=642074 RepID=A0ABD0YQU0_9HEMI
MFCGLTQCELEPCLFGECELTGAWFRCICQQGYHGDACGQRHRPCATNPCNSRGKCIETNEASFRCECHAWWEGTTCERRMQHIPYKPLSERMLQEPFWLGLITVTIVLAILGLFWCAKRHFPEKLEKLLAEEDRNRPCQYAVQVSSSRSASMRERQCSREVLAVQAAPRSLLGRLGIRKPSLLGQLPHPIHNTSRTFSLDDLLKPPPSKAPSTTLDSRPTHPYRFRYSSLRGLRHRARFAPHNFCD